MVPLLAVDMWSRDTPKKEYIIIDYDRPENVLYVNIQGQIRSSSSYEFRILRPATEEDWQRLYGDNR
jgi:hypothetical protein